MRHNDGWVRATEHDTARLEAEMDCEAATGGSEACPPGTIWERRTELCLEASTRLLLRQTRPRVRKLSVMGYLTQGLGRPGRIVHEREFAVVGNYRLRPVGQARTATEAARPGRDRPEAGHQPSSEAPRKRSA